MPLKFIKKPGTTASASETGVAKDTIGVVQAGNATYTAAGNGVSSDTPSSSKSFMKKGAAAQTLLAQEEAKSEQLGQMYRYYMLSENDERRITFLDGELDSDGFLDVPMFLEHDVTINGDRQKYVCTQSHDTSEPCPICARGDSKPYLVGLLTIIDHTGMVPTKGKNQGKLVGKNQRRLYAAKKETLKKLKKMAEKRGGLTGCTFEVSRSGETSAAVGDTFEFEQKRSFESIASEEGVDLKLVQPADYDQEITYRSPELLIQMGVGKGFSAGVGAKKAGADLANEL